MLKYVLPAFAALFAFVLVSASAIAQTSDTKPGYEKKSYTYEEWIKGRFAEVVTVTNPGKWIYLAGIGSEQEGDGKILFPGDFYKQCKYAYYRIQKLLALHGATLKDLVFVTTYVTDVRKIGESGRCRREEFSAAGAELPPGATVGVSAFANPDMMLEIAATAVLPK
ncbi:MAG: RidA family protein [Deltaproteobacteria bacterium]|nr:RidA family protein [Deltaproteobacteria bacterium]